MSCECEDKLVERDREIEELSDEAELMRARAERAEAAIERVWAMVDEMGEAVGFDNLVHGREAEYPVSYLRDKLEEALEPDVALDTGKEKSDEKV